jgi:hypothetical protein
MTLVFTNIIDSFTVHGKICPPLDLKLANFSNVTFSLEAIYESFTGKIRTQALYLVGNKTNHFS